MLFSPHVRLANLRVECALVLSFEKVSILKISQRLCVCPFYVHNIGCKYYFLNEYTSHLNSCSLVCS